MRIERIKLHDVGPFGDFEVDLTTLQGPLVAVVGPNGAGKSTLLELGLPGALYRATPTRGSLTALATSRNAIVEATVVNGARYTLRHVLDGVNGKSEAVALDADGKPCFESSKVRDFDSWASTHLPPPEVLYSTGFQPQGAAGFLAMKPAERKSVLLRILGIERFERMAEAARELARAYKGKLEVASARLTDERARSGDVAVLEIELSNAQVDAVGRDEMLSHARKDLETAEVKLREIDEVTRKNADLATHKAALHTHIAAKSSIIADLQRRVENNRSVLAEGDEIRKAVAEAEQIRAELTQAKADRASIETELRRHDERSADTRQRIAAVEQRIARGKEALKQRAEVEKAAAELPELERLAEAAAGAVAVAETALEDLRGERVAGAEERIKDLRGGLQLIASAGSEMEDPIELIKTAHSTIEADDKVMGLAKSLPDQLRQAEAALRAAKDRQAVADRRLSDARAVAVQADAVASAQADLEAAERERAELLQQADNAATAAREEYKDLSQLDDAQTSLSLGLARIEALARKAEPLAKAEARLAELEPQLEAAKAELERLEGELAALPEPEPTAERPDVEGIRRQLQQAEQRARDAHAAVTRAEQRLEQAQASAARIAELEGERAGIEVELADWNRLAADLGKDGLQALEIDAAGPELTTLVNDLLHTCHGPRWTVRIDTQRLSSDKKRMLEGCDVIVLDTERGRKAEASTFSGGERVILGEAVSLALSMLACRRAGVDRPTLVRDESGAALDPENAAVYLAMLRRAAGVIGADKVLFVSHNPEVVAMADGRIDLGQMASAGSVAA